MTYEKNVELARYHGFKAIEDSKAYKGVYYIKNDKIWIHDIQALKNKLCINSDDELRDLGYEVDKYHFYKKYTDKMVDDEMKRIYTDITHCDGEPTYLHDGVWLYPDGSMGER